MNKIKYCKLDGCNIKVNSLGYCRKHYRKFNLYGDANFIRVYKTKYNLDDNFFSKYTEEAFYWAGFIAADGCLFPSKNSRILSINLSIIDQEHLEKFKKNIKSNHKLNYSFKKDRVNGFVGIRIYSVKIFDDLFNIFNLTERKTLTYDPPENLKNHEMIRHFLRGYFDGDGCIFQKRQSEGCFNILGTKKCMKYFESVINNYCGFSANIAIKSKNTPTSSDIYNLSYTSRDKIKKLYNFLYNNSTIFLQRKKDKFENILNLIDNYEKFYIKKYVDNRGEKSGRSKLNNDQILEIRNLYKLKLFTSRSLGEKFKVSHKTILAIVNNKTWSHI